MEILSVRMPSAFKTEDSWKCKRAFQNKSCGQPESKSEVRSERAVNYRSVTSREGSGRRPCPVASDVWEENKRVVHHDLSTGRMNLKFGGASVDYPRKQEKPRESSDDAETSQEALTVDSDHSGDDEPPPAQGREAPHKWPIIRTVDPPAWLPPGWTAVLRIRESGSKDKYYVDPLSKRRFRSKTEVNYYLQTGKSYRYKRDLALLTKPLKEDPVSLTAPANLRALPRPEEACTPESEPGLPSPSYGGECMNSEAAPFFSNRAPDLRLSMCPPQAEQPCKPLNKPGPRARTRVVPEEPPTTLTLGPKKRVVEERVIPEDSEGQVRGSGNRSKLVLKLKRKATGPVTPDEGQGSVKEPRICDGVGVMQTHHGKSRSSTSEEEERCQCCPEGVGHRAGSTGRLSHSTMVEPNNILARWASIIKAPPSVCKENLSSFAVGYPQCDVSANPTNSSSVPNQHLPRTSGSVSLLDSQNVRASTPTPLQGPLKRETPVEQLQKLGRKLCLSAVDVLSSEHGRIDTFRQVSHALRSSVTLSLASGLKTSVNTIPNSMFSTGFFASHGTGPGGTLLGLGMGKSAIRGQKYSLEML